MLIPLTVRIRPNLCDAIEQLAIQRNTTVFDLLRTILEDKFGNKNCGFDDLREYLQFSISLSLKTLYLSRFMAEGIDKDMAEQIIKEADSYITENGLKGSQHWLDSEGE